MSESSLSINIYIIEDINHKLIQKLVGILQRKLLQVLIDSNSCQKIVVYSSLIIFIWGLRPLWWSDHHWKLRRSSTHLGLWLSVHHVRIGTFLITESKQSSLCSVSSLLPSYHSLTRSKSERWWWGMENLYAREAKTSIWG